VRLGGPGLARCAHCAAPFHSPLLRHFFPPPRHTHTGTCTPLARASGRFQCTEEASVLAAWAKSLSTNTCSEQFPSRLLHYYAIRQKDSYTPLKALDAHKKEKDYRRCVHKSSPSEVSGKREWAAPATGARGGGGKEKSGLRPSDQWHTAPAGSVHAVSPTLDVYHVSLPSLWRTHVTWGGAWCGTP
jgi:hypothetical protein